MLVIFLYGNFLCVHYIVIFCMGKNVWQFFVWQFFVCVQYIVIFCMVKNTSNFFVCVEKTLTFFCMVIFCV